MMSVRNIWYRVAKFEVTGLTGHSESKRGLGDSKNPLDTLVAFVQVYDTFTYLLTCLLQNDSTVHVQRDLVKISQLFWLIFLEVHATCWWSQKVSVLNLCIIEVELFGGISQKCLNVTVTIEDFFLWKSLLR